MRFAIHCLLPLFVFASLLGCAPDPRLSVSGSASVELGGTSSGFNFDQPTRLSEDALETLPEGTPAGSCVFGPEGVSFGLARSAAGTPGSVGLESFDLVIRDSGPDAGSAELSVRLSDGLYLPSAPCDARLDYADRGDRVASFNASCALEGPSGAAQFVANLEYAACRRQ